MSSKVGKPLITLKDLPENWKEICLDCGDNGKTIVQLCLKLGICDDTHYRLIKDHPEYSATIKEFLKRSENWWLEVGQEGVYKTSGGDIVHTNVSSTMWYMNMKNRFGWRDKQEIEHSGSIDTVIKITGEEEIEDEE